jgi:diguanylate cyclase (GGDEF)-like protein/PAS domain S-box-containing protein
LIFLDYIIWLLTRGGRKKRKIRAHLSFLSLAFPPAILTMKVLDIFKGRPAGPSTVRPSSKPLRPRAGQEGKAKPHDVALLQQIAETSPVGIMVVNLSGHITFANSQVEKIFGLRKDKIIHRFHNGPEWRFTDTDGRPFPEDKLPFRRVMAAGLPVYDVQHAVEGPDGKRVFLSINAAPLFNDQGRVEGVVAAILDITERKRAEEKLRYISTHDTLTGVYNRAYFEEEFARLEQGGQFPLSVIIADLDGLKATNDSQGHAAGDELLRRTGQVLMSVFRSEDVAARIGGDEFAVLLPVTDVAAGQAAMTRFQRVLAQHNSQVGGVPLSLSLGLATGQWPCSLSQILKEADQSLYLAKQTKPRTDISS